MTIILALGSALLLFLVSVSLILLLIGPTLLLKPKRRTPDFYRSLGLPVTPSELQLPYEEINIIASDGIKLNMWLIKSAQPARGTIVYLHGVADCKIDGLRLAKLLHDHHFNVALFDSRAHGDSEGTFCTYGYFEKHDVITIINYLQTRSDISIGAIGIFGTSMGAAIALQSAAIDNRIRAVVAENSFATLRTIFDDYQRRMVRLPFHYLRNIVIKRSELMAHFKANDVSPLESVKQLHIPVLYIYGTDDHLISCDYSKMLYQQTPGAKEVFPIEGATHNDTWKVAGTSYETKILSFFKHSLA
jgi:pimeloyl-ACP methyl ester carboxylesterase